MKPMANERPQTDKAPADTDPKNPQVNPQPAPPAETPEKEEDPFDFGGLPKRDLKKNLGCG
ncbi:hypothetical protein [Chryseolinea lacunae]|uniref:Uncharacterized protein n=1 Tax=Chryseolinea lacunae TaxID=2801331 RepID=A0ABS1KQI6_9BACT|nr:hypothetical protein [Chryseolinea lacunae]MBL0741701.1 hypothetical protein [Chryseolinea lacunae]